MSTTRGKRRRPSAPHLPIPAAPVAAAIVGAVCGLLAVGLVWLGGRGCDALRGTPSCGGFGVIMLVVIVAAMLAVGVYGLRAVHVRDAGMVTFFGVALPLIMIMSLLIDAVFSPWMALVVPLLGAGCFAAAAYVVPAMENSLDEENAEVAGQAEPEAPTGTGRASMDLPRYAPAEPSARTESAPGQATAEQVGDDSGEVADHGSELLAEDGEPLLGSAEAEPDDAGSDDAEPDDAGKTDPSTKTGATRPTTEHDNPAD